MKTHLKLLSPNNFKILSETNKLIVKKNDKRKYNRGDIILARIFYPANYFGPETPPRISNVLLKIKIINIEKVKYNNQKLTDTVIHFSDFSI